MSRRSLAVDRESGTVQVVKVPSTPADPSVAFLGALERMDAGLLRKKGLRASRRAARADVREQVRARSAFSRAVPSGAWKS